MKKYKCLTPGRCMYLGSKLFVDFGLAIPILHEVWTCSYCGVPDHLPCDARGEILECDTCVGRFKCWTE